MSYLMSNIPHFPCWVRREFTHNHLKYHGEFLHALAIAVNTIPDRSLSFQVVFTGNEMDRDDWKEGNIHGGAMWARMPIQALVADIPMDEWAEPMENHLAQPWDCESRTHSVVTLDRTSSSPWIAKIGSEFYTSRYLFTVDYTDNSIADDPAQHKQSHILALTSGEFAGQIVAQPNNRVIFYDKSYTPSELKFPDFKVSTIEYSVEGEQKWTAGDDDKFFYDIEERKE